MRGRQSIKKEFGILVVNIEDQKDKKEAQYHLDF